MGLGRRQPWLELRLTLPIGPLLCVINGTPSRATSIYPQGIDNGEIIDTVHSRHAPMVPVSASLRL